MKSVDLANLQNTERGRLAENIMHFGRLLRSAGLPVGPGKVIEAIKAVNVIDLSDRYDFYWCLHSVFVNRQDQSDLFDQAFHVFWQNPKLLERIMSLALPTPIDSAPCPSELISPRLKEALPNVNASNSEIVSPEIDKKFDAAMTWSSNEMLSELDFEKMTSTEMEEAKKIMKKLTLPIKQIVTRRYHPNFRGTHIDLRSIMKHSLKYGGDYIPLKKKSRLFRSPPLTILCDISGSMERYSRMLLHFIHILTNDRDRVNSFLFGTRLTNITRFLHNKDVDEALEVVSSAIEDWSGGTRIALCINEFNKKWSRRILGQNSVVLLISDGLDRDAGLGLSGAMDRLHKSCHKLIWLNPLLRYEAFEPKSQGVRAILPFVDDFRSIHNLKSLSQLADILSYNGPNQEKKMKNWRERAV